jgi:16S rRNA U1498 N3-methylase RsmE
VDALSGLRVIKHRGGGLLRVIPATCQLHPHSSTLSWLQASIGNQKVRVTQLEKELERERCVVMQPAIFELKRQYAAGAEDVISEWASSFLRAAGPFKPIHFREHC